MSQVNEKETPAKADWFKRATDSITAIVVVAGFAFTVSQIWRLQESTDMSAWNAVSQQWLNMDKLLVQNSDVRKYVYNTIPISQDNPESDKVMAIAIYVLDFVDNAISTSNYIVTKYPGEKSVIHPQEWESYFRQTFFKSAVICDTLKQIQTGYHPETRRIGLDECKRHEERP